VKLKGLAAFYLQTTSFLQLGPLFLSTTMASTASTYSSPVASVLGDLLSIHPSTAPALVSPSAASLSYGQLASHVQALAQDLAVPHGQAVALALPNSIELVLAFFAVATLGAVACPFNPGYTESEFEVCRDPYRAIKAHDTPM
jgi:acyl-CoA synthetase (AMP-forming)/AMP-acid ligase II